MDTATWLALAAIVLAFAALALALLHRAIFARMLGDRPARAVLFEHDYRNDRARDHEARVGTPQSPRVSSNQVLAGPPMIGNYTLRDWLIHSTHSDGVWSDVVAKFYQRAADVDWVLDYFGAVLARPDGMAQLQRHFTAQLVVLTHTGVTQAMLDDLAQRHARVTNSRGEPITHAVFDAVRDTLVGVLRDVGVPDRATDQLRATVEPFRAVLVRG